MRILVWVSFPTFRGPIQLFSSNAMNFEMGNGMWAFEIIISNFWHPISHIPHQNFYFPHSAFPFSFAHAFACIRLFTYLNSLPLTMVPFNLSHNITPLNNLTSHVSTYDMKWETRNEKWEIGCGKWEMRSWKWEVGSEEMGNKRDVELDPEKWEMRLKREFS